MKGRRKQGQAKEAPSFEKRWSAGFSEYRYGTKKPISLAGQKPKPIHGKERHKHLVDKAMDILRDWRQSPFEFEAPCRHGLRASFCASGHDWYASDAEAAAIVSESLNAIGAKRPAYDEGQRHYTTSPDACLWCSGPLDENQVIKGQRFCSSRCASLAIDRREFQSKNWSDRAYALAVRESQRVHEHECAVCKKGFMSRNPDARFCSTACRDASRKKKPDTVCRACGVLFPKISGRAVYCSVACRDQGNTIPKFNHAACEWCAKPYVSARRETRYCSNLCRGRASDARSGRFVSKQLSVGAFDHFITRPVNEARASWLSPQRLDWMLLEQGARITCEVRVAA